MNLWNRFILAGMFVLSIGLSSTPVHASSIETKAKSLRKKVPTAELSEPYTTSDTSKAEYWYDLARLYRHQSKKYVGTDTRLANQWDTKAREVFLKGVRIDMQIIIPSNV